MNLLAQLNERKELDAKYDDYNENLQELTSDDIGGDGTAYPQILVLFIDSSTSMCGDRIKEVRKYIRSQIPKSERVILYTMDIACFKLTECLKKDEFISSINDTSLGALWESYGSYVAVKSAPSSDYPNGVSGGYYCRAKCNKMTKNGCYDYSKDFKFSLNNFSCYYYTNIVHGLTVILNECIDLIKMNDNIGNQQSHKYNIYLLFATDAEDDKVTNDQIINLQKLLNKTRQTATNHHVEFFSEIYIIGDKKGVQANQYQKMRASSLKLLEKLFESTIYINTQNQKNLGMQLTEEAHKNDKQFKIIQNTIKNTFKPMKESYNNHVKVIKNMQLNNQKCEKIIIKSKDNIKNIAGNIENVNGQINNLNGEYYAIKAICQNMQSMTEQENELTQEKIENLNEKLIQIHDNTVDERQKIENELKTLTNEEKGVNNNCIDAEKAIKEATQTEVTIEQIKKEMYPINDNKDRSVRKQLTNWFKNKVTGLRKKIVQLLKAGGKHLAKAWSLHKDIKKLHKKLKNESNNLETIENELRNKIEELENLLGSLEDAQ